MDPKSEHFIGLFKSSGWTQAEVARQLRITPGAVSQLCKGTTRPHARTLAMFRMVLQQRKAVALKAFDRAHPWVEPSWSVGLIEDLKGLTEKGRRKVLKIIKEIIRTVQPAGEGRRT